MECLMKSDSCQHKQRIETVVRIFGSRIRVYMNFLSVCKILTVEYDFYRNIVCNLIHLALQITADRFSIYKFKRCHLLFY